MKMLLLAATGGAFGAAARYAVGVGAGRVFGIGFPAGTLIVNVLGCFLMGCLIQALALRYSASLELRTFLATGVLGGFTTFSAFALDFAVLLERKNLPLAFSYLASSVVLSLLAVFAGLALMRHLLQ